MRFTLTHTLTYNLPGSGRAVSHLLLTAPTTPQQTVERWSIDMPGFGEAAVFRDGFGNRAHMVSQSKHSDPMVVTASGVVVTTDKAGVLGRMEFDPPPALYRRPSELAKADPALIEGLAPGSRIATLHELMERVHERREATQGQSEAGQQQSFGSDDPVELSHAFIGAARALGVPTRYVTGYLHDDGAATFHAWAEAWDDGLGWIGFDPLLNLCPVDNHIRLASGLDAIGTMPIRTVPIWTEMPVETVEIAAG